MSFIGVFFFLHNLLMFVSIAGQQLNVELPHITVGHHLHYFAWVQSQVIPSEILNVVFPSIVFRCK